VEPSHARFRFYAELNDHLPEALRYHTLERTFLLSSTVKDMVESFGVPHTEVELIVANGESVGFSSSVKDGDRIAIYPKFESFDIMPELRVRPGVLREIRFVLDVHLGRLAAYLRMLGFDALYERCSTDPELVQISSSQQRVLLTRDRSLLKHAAITHGYWLRETNSRRQIAEIVHRFDLARSIRSFTRCMRCNAVLQPVLKEQVHKSMPARIAALHEDVMQCPNCERLYWRGSHYGHMGRWIEELASVH
jgi:uncharacterized protein with PIN domain